MNDAYHVVFWCQPPRPRPPILVSLLSFPSTGGIANTLWSGVHRDYNVLVMDVLGPSLQDMFIFCGHRFSLKTVLLIIDQVPHPLNVFLSFRVDWYVKIQNRIQRRYRKYYCIYTLVALGIVTATFGFRNALYT